MNSFAACRPALAAALLGAGIAWAQDPEANALMLADEAIGTLEKASDWRAFVEGAHGSAAEKSQRLSLDIQYDRSLSPEWRVFLADRLDTSRPAPNGGDNGINTLKEAYLGWRAQPETMLDMGRINVRNGVAMGYNPTDYFRSGALRSVVSISPASLKEDRQGSIMLRAQRLWESGSLTALYSPELKRRRDTDGLSLDVGATNDRNRWLIAASQKVGGFTPQFLVYREEEMPAQFGFNLTGLLGNATVAHVEWSGGRGPSLLTQALKQPAPTCACNAWRNRLSAGLTYTTPKRISLTAEYHYNGGGLDETAWNALRQGPPAIYGQYRRWVQTAQELPTRQALFFHGTWQDAMINRLDISAMHNLDLADSSHRTWLEARYHVGNFEYALQWQRNGGRPSSNYGAVPESRGWQAAVRHYF